MDYEDIVYARECIEDLKNCDRVVNKKFLESMIAVLDYADDCYIGHCEDIGIIAIEEIEEMRKDVIEKAANWFDNELRNPKYDTYQEVIENFKKAMEE